MRKPQEYLLACDPGSENFGYALYLLGDEPGSWLLLESGVLKCPVKDMRDRFSTQAHAFRNEVARLLERHGFVYDEDAAASDYLWGVAERFVARGMRSSTIAENVNVMIGILSVLCDNLDVLLASEWKHYINKYAGTFGYALVGTDTERKKRAASTGVQCLYADWKERSGGRLRGVKSHAIDAVLIGQHWLTTFREVPRLALRDDFDDLLVDIDKTYVRPEKKAAVKKAKRSSAKAGKQ